MKEGEKISTLLRIKGITQEALSTALGFRQQFWSRHRNTRRVPEKWWPVLERELGMNRAAINAFSLERLEEWLGSLGNSKEE